MKILESSTYIAYFDTEEEKEIIDKLAREFIY
jgi:hypothetical protein